MEVVRWFTIAAAIYAVVGTLVGVIIASELAFPFLNLDIPYIPEFLDKNIKEVKKKLEETF